jgi:regulator of cell morphogenesis and NO signaling
MITTTETLDVNAASVADVALAFPNAITVFNKYNLDYCCHGKTSFLAACKNAELDYAKVWQEIQQAGLRKSSNALNFEAWNSSVLIDFILQHHHEYVRSAIPKIRELLTKICQVHGDTNPELLLVRADFENLAEELLNHLPKEEQILFPAMKRMEEIIRISVENPMPLQMPMQVMEAEHEHAGELIKAIRTKTNHYTPPAYACPTYQLAFVMLREFEEDLMQHIHLENNILFERVKSVSSN